MFNSLSNPLIERIPEISYLVSTVLMIFASDFIAERMLIGYLRKMTFLSRTVVFLVWGLAVLPAATAGTAYLLRKFVLEPYSNWIILILLGIFLIIGVLLSLRYNLKMKFKIK